MNRADSRGYADASIIGGQRLKEKIKSFLQRISVAEPETITTKERKAVLRGLLYLFSLQTATEQQSESTYITNHQGFNHADAAKLSSIAKWGRDSGYITPKQARLCARRMMKYSGQLEAIAK